MNVLLSHALQSTEDHLRACQARASAASARRDSVRLHIEELERTESLVRAEVTAAMREEGAMQVERSELQSRETKLQNELKSAQSMMRDAVQREKLLSEKHQLLVDQLGGIDELSIAEERLRAVQMIRLKRTHRGCYSSGTRVELQRKLQEYKVHALLETI